MGGEGGRRGEGEEGRGRRACLSCGKRVVQMPYMVSYLVDESMLMRAQEMLVMLSSGDDVGDFGLNVRRFLSSSSSSLDKGVNVAKPKPGTDGRYPLRSFSMKASRSGVAVLAARLLSTREVVPSSPKLFFDMRSHYFRGTLCFRQRLHGCVNLVLFFEYLLPCS